MSQISDPLHFGASVTTGSEPETSGIVADNGEVYLSGLPAAGVLHATWGKTKSCSVLYQLDDSLGTTIQTQRLECQ